MKEAKKREDGNGEGKEEEKGEEKEEEKEKEACYSIENNTVRKALHFSVNNAACCLMPS
ncbi:MAG: hypothetical protein WDN66_02435 [Candidatus Saccharibacteria bacterium]